MMPLLASNLFNLPLTKLEKARRRAEADLGEAKKKLSELGKKSSRDGTAKTRLEALGSMS